MVSSLFVRESRARRSDSHEERDRKECGHDWTAIEKDACRQVKKRLILVGGGHGHLYTLSRMGDLVRAGCEVIVISESSHQYYSGMGPGMLSGIYRPSEIRFNIRKMTEDRGGVFIEDAVDRVLASDRRLVLRSGAQVSYDVASFNIGSRVSRDWTSGAGAAVFPVKPIINLLRARERIAGLLGKGKPTITIAGGGPAGVEVAGNAWRLVRDLKGDAQIQLIAGSRFLGGHPERARRGALSSLTKRGIEVREGVRVSAVTDDGLALSDGTSLRSDVVFIAVGVSPPALFSESGLPTGPEGGLRVNRFLQSTGDESLYGCGDCISYEPEELARVGVYAVRQGPVIFRNITASLRGGNPVPFSPGGAYLLILNMGDGRGILWRRSLFWDGRLAFVLKDYIDRRFMRHYQLSGEQREPDGA